MKDTAYHFSNTGLWLETDNGPRKLGNFVVIPHEFITKENGATVEKLVKVYGYSTAGQLPDVILPPEKYESMNWITKEWEFSAIMEPPRSNAANHIWRIAQELGRALAKSTVIYTHMGWRRVADDWCYFHSGGVIGVGNARVELDGDAVRYALPAPAESYQEAVKASLRLKDVVPSEIAVPLLALVYLSPLNEFFRQAGCEPAFVTMLAGPTGTMKSTLAVLALCHFGQFTAKSLPGNFKDTRNALEVKGFALKDTLMVVDDFYPSAQRSEYARMASTMQALLRSYGDRSGRGRLSSDVKLRAAYVPRGNLLVTGEDIPNLEESGLARLFLLEISPGEVDKELLATLQKDAPLLGQAMRGYIEWLIPQADTLKDVLLEKFTDYRQQAQEGHPRMAEIVAWLQIGYEMFLDYAIFCGVVPSEDRQGALDEALSIFMALVNRQTEMMKKDTPTFQFLSALNEMLASDQYHCIKLDDEGSPRGGLKGRGFIGYVDSDNYYLYPDITINAVTDFYNRRGIRFPATKNMLLKQLARAGAIEETTGQERVNRTPVKRIDGKNQRFIHLKREALDQVNTSDEG